jgi:hypothetical protein
MAAIDDAVRRTRAAIADYDATREAQRTYKPSMRGHATDDSDVYAAAVKVIGATEYLLILIESERDTL